MEKLEWAKYYGFDENMMDKLTMILDMFNGKIINIKNLTIKKSMIYYS